MVTETRPTNAVLFADVFHNISSPISDTVGTTVPTSVEYHFNISSEAADSRYAHVEESKSDNYPEVSGDYIYDDFMNYSSPNSFDYNEYNNIIPETHRHQWIEYNVTSAHLNHSDLHISDGKIWDPKANFLEGVVGNLFLVPLAFIVGLCIGVILWGIFVLIRKLLIALIRWLKTKFPQTSDQMWCCGKRFCLEPKINKSRTVWYEDSIRTISNHDNDITIHNSKKLSEITTKDKKICEVNNNDTLAQNHSPKRLYKDGNSNNENGNRTTKKESNSTFFVSNEMSNSPESHQQSGISNKELIFRIYSINKMINYNYILLL